MRHMITAKQGDEVGHGVYERLVPSRISLKWLRFNGHAHQRVASKQVHVAASFRRYIE